MGLLLNGQHGRQVRILLKSEPVLPIAPDAETIDLRKSESLALYPHARAARICATSTDSSLTGELRRSFCWGTRMELVSEGCTDWFRPVMFGVERMD
jgi:hypothetical protein